MLWWKKSTNNINIIRTGKIFATYHKFQRANVSYMSHMYIWFPKIEGTKGKINEQQFTSMYTNDFYTNESKFHITHNKIKAVQIT